MIKERTTVADKPLKLSSMTTVPTITIPLVLTSITDNGSMDARRVDLEASFSSAA